jgi:hypothetical protein
METRRKNGPKPALKPAPKAYIGCPSNPSATFPFLNTPIPQANPDKQWDIPWSQRADLGEAQLGTHSAVYDALSLTSKQRRLLGKEAQGVFFEAYRSKINIFEIGEEARRQQALDTFVEDYVGRWGVALNIPKSVIIVPLRQLIGFELDAHKERTRLWGTLRCLN